MIIPKVNIKNILSSESSTSPEKTKEISPKEKDQEKTSSSSSPKDYNKEECLNNLWIELISLLFDENPKTTIKELMSSKKYSNHSYLERSSSEELRKKGNSESTNVSEMSNPSTPSRRSIFKIGNGHSRNNSSTSKKNGKKDVITNEPETFSAEEEALFNSNEEVVDANAAINLDSKEFKQKLWECLFWSAGNEGIDTLLLRFIVARKGKVNDALKMLLNALIWRVTYDIEGLCKKGERIIDEEEFSCGKVYFYKYDKDVDLLHISMSVNI